MIFSFVFSTVKLLNGFELDRLLSVELRLHRVVLCHWEVFIRLAEATFYWEFAFQFVRSWGVSGHEIEKQNKNRVVPFGNKISNYEPTNRLRQNQINISIWEEITHVECYLTWRSLRHTQVPSFFMPRSMIAKLPGKRQPMEPHLELVCLLQAA